MSRLALGAAFATGFAWIAARFAVAQLIDEEVDRHGWISAAGDQVWSSRGSEPTQRPLVLDMPQPQASRIYSAA